jgi:hypothetical protein
MEPTQVEHLSGVALASIWLALGYTPKYFTTLTGTNTLAYLTLTSSSVTKKKMMITLTPELHTWEK